MKDLILLVEDDIIFGETVKDYFESNRLYVIWAKNGTEAVQLFKDEHPELVMLDVVLPDKDGFQVAAEIMKINSIIPFIFMTGTALSDNDFSNAYQSLHAKNYLEKPIKLSAALAQVKSLLYPSGVKIFNINNLHIKINNQQLTINEQNFQLREKDIQILSFLLEKKNQTVDRQDILLKVWNSDGFHLENTLDSCISRLKKILKNFPDIKLKTIYGRGYLLLISQ